LWDPFLIKKRLFYTMNFCIADKAKFNSNITKKRFKKSKI